MNRRYPLTLAYWASQPDGFGGHTYADPVALNGRWEDHVELIEGNNGETFTSHAIVYVDADVKVDDYIVSGGIFESWDERDSWANDVMASWGGDPLVVDGSFRIKKVEKIANIRYSDYIIKVTL